MEGFEINEDTSIERGCRCPKCSSTQIRIWWCNGNPSAICWEKRGDFHNKCRKGEHLHRKCQVCGFEWLDLTDDRKGE